MWKVEIMIQFKLLFPDITAVTMREKTHSTITELESVKQIVTGKLFCYIGTITSKQT